MQSLRLQSVSKYMSSGCRIQIVQWTGRSEYFSGAHLVDHVCNFGRGSAGRLRRILLCLVLLLQLLASLAVLVDLS